jgi:signal peptidase II
MLRRFIMTFAIVTNLILLDQVVKEIAVCVLKSKVSVDVIPNFFNLTYVENRGCAWGMLQNQTWLLVSIAVIMLVLLIWRSKWFFPDGIMGRVIQVCLFAGIIGNLWDRLFRGYVVDMFDFHWGIHHFPVFNVADVFICVAAGLLIISSFCSKDDDKKENKKVEVSNG